MLALKVRKFDVSIKGHTGGRMLGGVGISWASALRWNFLMDSFVPITSVIWLVHFFLCSSHNLWCVFKVQSKHLLEDFVPRFRNMIYRENTNLQFIMYCDIPVPTYTFP